MISHIFGLLAQYNLHIFIPLVIMCWYLHKFDKKTTMLTKTVDALCEATKSHEVRLDDHEVRITRLDTKVCYIDRRKDVVN